MKRFPLLLFVFATCLLSCGEDKKTFTQKNSTPQDPSETSDPALPVLDMTWKDGPFVGVKKNRTNRFRLHFFSNPSVNPAIAPVIESLEFRPYMKIHGHGGGGRVQIQRISDNEFEVSGFVFVMDGPWELEFKYKYLGQTYEWTSYLRLL